MNRFFVVFAAILTSGIFAFSYLREWVNYALLDKVLDLRPTDTIDFPYFHSSEALYLKVTLIFGLVFLLLFGLSVFFSLKKKWGMVYLCFVMNMLAILAMMVNGAIK